jgi:hypothetical protein
MALLNSTKSRKPIPPKPFGVESHSHDLQCIFRRPSSIPHQKSAVDLLIEEHVARGRRKQLITKVEIAWMTVFKNTSLPALDIGRPEQVFILFHALLGRKRKHATGECPTSVGMPRYVSCRASLCTPIRFMTPLFRAPSQLFSKKMVDLS